MLGILPMCPQYIAYTSGLVILMYHNGYLLVFPLPLTSVRVGPVSPVPSALNLACHRLPEEFIDSRVLQPKSTGFAIQQVASISSQTYVQLHHTSCLKLVMVGVLTLQKSANMTFQGPSLFLWRTNC